MITKDEFIIYSDNLRQWWLAFSYRFEATNKCANNPIVYKPRNPSVLLMEWDLKSHIDAYSIYWLFRWTSLFSMQQSRIMCVARLLDPPYFLWNRKIPNLWLMYLKDKIEDTNIKKRIDDIFIKHQSFIESITVLRHKKLSHNTVDEKPEKINKWVEDFFKDVLSILKDINKVWWFEIGTPDMLVETWVAKSWLEELFKKVI